MEEVRNNKNVRPLGPGKEVMAFAADRRSDAHQVATALSEQGISARVITPEWGTGEWVVEIRLNHRIAQLLGLDSVINSSVPIYEDGSHLVGCCRDPLCVCHTAHSNE